MNARVSLRGLRTFCLAARHKSFRQAADALFVTASAVSHQIIRLEEEIGTPLFDRQPRAVALTPAGRSLYEELGPLIEELDSAVARHRGTASRETLRISVQPFFASELFVPALNAFTKRYPEIDLEVQTSDEASEKHPSKADVSIRIFKSTPKELKARRLFSLKLVPACSPEFKQRLRTNGKTVLTDFPRVVHESRPKAWDDWQDMSGIRFSEDSKLVRLDSMIAVARAAERGLGAALVPTQLSESWFNAGKLVRLFDDELETSDAYYIAYREDDADRSTVRRFEEWALQEFEEAA
ncbi:MAG: LysR substrate-binding domain-containing protein [Woeseiaceae bacterium]|nr:LysR substrate-binding domain-containing protein [Woeseiaceae bacterium]